MYNANLDVKRIILRIEKNEVKNRLPISCIKTKIPHIYNLDKLNKYFKIYSAQNLTLETNTENIIRNEIKIEKNRKFPKNSILMLDKFDNQNYNIAPGVIDHGTTKNTLFITNNTKNTLRIPRNMVLCTAKSISEGKTYKPAKSRLELDLILQNYKGPEERKFEFKKILQNIEENLKETKELDYQHKIVLKEESPSINIKPYRCSIKEKEIIEAETLDMLNKNVIRESHSCYSSPVVLIKKKNGEYRFCIDYRRLNQYTVRDLYPLPRIDDTLDNLKHAV